MAHPPCRLLLGSNSTVDLFPFTNRDPLSSVSTAYNSDHVAQTPSSEEDYTIELTFVEYNREKLAKPVTFLIIYQRLEGRIMNENHQINRSPEEKQLQSLTETTKMIGCSGSLWEALWLRSV